MYSHPKLLSLKKVLKILVERDKLFLTLTLVKLSLML